MIGFHFCKNICFRSLFKQCPVAHLTHLHAGKYHGAFKSYLLCKTGCHQFIITGNYFKLYPQIMQVGYCLLGILFGWIKQSNKTKKNHINLLFFCKVFIAASFFISYTQYPKTGCTQRCIFVVNGGQFIFNGNNISIGSFSHITNTKYNIEGTFGDGKIGCRILNLYG